MADSKMVVTDNLVNLVSGLGTSRAKSANSAFTDTNYSDHTLLTTYRQNWLAAKIVDIPAQDATREWRSWQADKGEIEKIERLERNLALQHKVLDALTLARLYGGAAIYIGTNASPSKPLNVETERLEYLAVISRRELSANEVEDDIRSPYFGQPKSYDLITRGSMVTIHPSRLVKFVGKSIPESFGSGYSYQQGWGDSVLVGCMEPLLRTESTMANAGELVFESQVSVMKVPDLLSQLNDPVYRQSILEMVALQAAGKGITKMMMIDALQDYQNHNATFAGVPEIINAFHQEDAGASGIPVTRLLGQSPGGLNSTGESDLRTHYDNIASMQKLTIGPALSNLDEMLIRAALGSRPEEVHYNWNNLWYPSAKEQADIGKTTAETVKILNETGLFNSDALSAAAVNLLTERGVVPGLEGAIEEFGTAEDDPQSDPNADPAAPGVTSNDSAPRSLYVSRKVKNTSDILAWAKSQGFDELEAAEDLHVTIAYSRDPVDWMKMGNDWQNDKNGSITINAGGPRVVEALGSQGAVVLMFASSDLSWRNMSIRERGASWDFPDYQPHITISYAAGSMDLSKVEPYTGKIELGPEVFEEIKED